MAGSWTELLQKLKNGEIDLLSDVSFMEDRAQDMLYASLPMGTEAYYIFVAPDNTDLTAEDYTSLNGKRVGVARNSFQEQAFLQCTEAGNRWEEVHVAMGVAVYDPSLDHLVIDTVRRADKIMYLNKRERKMKV